MTSYPAASTGKGSAAFILVAVADPLLSPEASHAAAATGCAVKTAADPRDINRLAPHAHAIVVDDTTARHVASLSRRRGIFFISADPGPINFELALACHSDQAFLMPAEAPELLEALNKTIQDRPAGESGAPALRASAHLTVALIGAGGGVGTSTIAASLARVACGLRPGAPVALIDGDKRSGGIDLLLGIESTPGARWPDLNLTEKDRGIIDPADLRAALPATSDGIAVLSAARSTITDPFQLSPEVLRCVTESLRTAPGLTVIDSLPDAIPQGVDFVFIVVSPEVRITAAAATLSKKLTEAGIICGVILRHRSWAGLSAEDVQSLVKMDVCAEIKYHKNLAQRCETSGLPHRLPRTLESSLRQMCRFMGWQ